MNDVQSNVEKLLKKILKEQEKQTKLLTNVVNSQNTYARKDNVRVIADKVEAEFTRRLEEEF